MRSSARLFLPVLLVIVELWITVAGTWMFLASAGRIHDEPSLPASSTLLVLGSLVDDGEPGDYVRARLDAAVDLYRTGRVERIINSGNGFSEAGNEPAVMRTYLEERGVPSEVISDDSRGFDTAASCSRAQSIFGLHQVVVVTQRFHLRRAIALCRDAGLDAGGVDAGCDCPAWTLVRNHIRETAFAGPRALLTALT